MEYCEGGSLSDVMRAVDGVFLESSIRTIAAAVVQGLSYLHDKRIMHRDVKCANILLTSQGGVKLADFGVSACLDRTIGKRHTKTGTYVARVQLFHIAVVCTLPRSFLAVLSRSLSLSLLR